MRYDTPGLHENYCRPFAKALFIITICQAWDWGVMQGVCVCVCVWLFNMLSRQPALDWGKPIGRMRACPSLSVLRRTALNKCFISPYWQTDRPHVCLNSLLGHWQWCMHYHWPHNNSDIYWSLRSEWDTSLLLQNTVQYTLLYSFLRTILWE